MAGLAAYPAGDPRARPAAESVFISATADIQRRRDALLGRAAVCWLEGNSHDSEPSHVRDALRSRLGSVAAPAPPPVELASEWAILTCICVAVVPTLVAYILNNLLHVHCTKSSVVVRCVDLTDAEAGEKAALWEGVLWCAMIQTAVAELARLLPCRRRRVRIRHGLAFVALVVATVGHCMYAAGVCLVIAADPGYVFYTISCSLTVFVLAVGDVFVFVVLLLARGGEDD